MTHELKCWPSYFEAVLDGRKKFEVRRNDRGFQAGDMLILREYRPDDRWYSGRQISALVSYVLSGPSLGIAPGHVVMSIVVEAAA